MSTLATIVPLPFEDPLVKARDSRRYPAGTVDPNERRVTDIWANALTQQSQQLASATQLVASQTSLTDQSASIAATDISDGTLAAGLYQFDWFITVRQADGVSLSLTVALDFTYNSQTKSKSYAAVTGNTTATFMHDGGLIRIDGNSPVRYAVTYTSGGGGPAGKFDFFATLRRIGA